MSIQDKKYEIDLTFEATAAKEGKTLNKPFRTPKGPKKFSVYVKAPNKKGYKIIHFGDSNMKDYTQHRDEKRRKEIKQELYKKIFKKKQVEKKRTRKEQDVSYLITQKIDLIKY